MASKHFLNNVTVPSPCTADWNSMIGNDQVRFCEHCNLQVHNLSQMTRNQAQRLISRSNGRLCVRYHRDRKGHPRVLPIRQRLRRFGRRTSQLAAGAFTATLSVTSAVADSSQSRQSENHDVSAVVTLDGAWGLGSSIVGTIKDPNGAVIAGAMVALSNQQSQVVLYTNSDFNGEFRIDSLEPGLYKIKIEAPGFAADEIDGIYVTPSGETRIDRSLSIAALEETVNAEDTAHTNFATSGVVAFVAPEDPFVRAAQEDNLENLTRLIAGTDVNLRDKRSGTTALEHAVRNANREMVQLLLSAGATVNSRNATGDTVLMMLDGDATSDLVWDLINSGASVNLKDENGNTALMQAALSPNLEALKTLLDAGAEVDAKNKAGQTALMLAASEGSVNAVRALVLAGADLNTKDGDNKNALARAGENDHPAVVRFLKSKGAFETVAQIEEVP
jgi:ankyrin repeat protein